MTNTEERVDWAGRFVEWLLLDQESTTDFIVAVMLVDAARSGSHTWNVIGQAVGLLAKDNEDERLHSLRDSFPTAAMSEGAACPICTTPLDEGTCPVCSKHEEPADVGA